MRFLLRLGSARLRLAGIVAGLLNQAIQVVDEQGDWLEIFLPDRRETGWVAKSEMDPSPAPYRPFPLSNRDQR